jgi:hypothetical protein
VALVTDRTGRVNATQDENADGGIDRRDDEVAARRLGTTYSSGSTTTLDPRSPAPAATVPEQRATTRTSVMPAVKEQPTITNDDSEVITPVEPRPRASGFATLGLIVGLLALVAVATGGLVTPGIGLGIIAALLAFGGVAATSSRYIAGKADALFGMLFALAAIVFGVLSLTGAVSWLSPHTNLVTELHQWLQTHASWMLRS